MPLFRVLFDDQPSHLLIEADTRDELLAATDWGTEDSSQFLQNLHLRAMPRGARKNDLASAAEDAAPGDEVITLAIWRDAELLLDRIEALALARTGDSKAAAAPRGPPI